MAYIFIPDITSMSKEVWRQERKKGIGGSDVGAILGVNKFRSVSDVYYDKIGAKMIRKETEKSKITLQIGNSLEEVVAEAFQDRYPSIEVHSDNAMYQHEKYPFALANIDRRLILPDGTNAILECKTLSSAAEWESTDFCKGIQGKCPLSYEYQVRHYMAVLDLDLAIIVGLDLLTKNLYIVYVPRDTEIENKMLAAEMEFWYFVENKKAPAVNSYFNRLCTEIKADAFKRFYGANKDAVYEIRFEDEIAMFNAINELSIKQQFHAAEAEKAKEEKEEIAMQMFLQCEKRMLVKPSKIVLNGSANGMAVSQYVSLTDAVAATFDVPQFVESYNSQNEQKLSKDIDEQTAILICSHSMPDKLGQYTTLSEKGGARFYFGKRKIKAEKRKAISKKA